MRCERRPGPLALPKNLGAQPRPEGHLHILRNPGPTFLRPLFLPNCPPSAAVALVPTACHSSRERFVLPLGCPQPGDSPVPAPCAGRLAVSPQPCHRRHVTAATSKCLSSQTHCGTPANPRPKHSFITAPALHTKHSPSARGSER